MFLRCREFIGAWRFSRIYETLFQEIREAQKGESFKKSAERIVTLKELWRDAGRFVEGVQYEKLEVQVFNVEIV